MPSRMEPLAAKGGIMPSETIFLLSVVVAVVAIGLAIRKSRRKKDAARDQKDHAGDGR